MQNVNYKTFSPRLRRSLESCVFLDLDTKSTKFIKRKIDKSASIRIKNLLLYEKPVINNSVRQTAEWEKYL